MQRTLDLVVIQCGECGMEFGVPNHWHTNKLNSHEAFWCPNGHCRAFTGKSEAEKLRDQLTAERAKLDQAKAEANWERRERAAAERREAAAKGQVTKLRKKAADGLCPCCDRHFADLQMHLASKHPDFKVVT
jgi:hypothetical protein